MPADRNPDGIEWTPGAPTEAGRWLCDVTDDRETGDRVAVLLTWRETPRGLRASLVWNDGEHILTPGCVVRHAPIPSVAAAREAVARECVAEVRAVLAGVRYAEEARALEAVESRIAARFGLDSSEPQPDARDAEVARLRGEVEVLRRAAEDASPYVTDRAASLALRAALDAPTGGGDVR